MLKSVPFQQKAVLTTLVYSASWHSDLNRHYKSTLPLLTEESQRTAYLQVAAGRRKNTTIAVIICKNKLKTAFRNFRVYPDWVGVTVSISKR